MRRLLATMAMLLLVASATTGLAAALRPGDTVLAAAAATVSRCDTDGVTLTYGIQAGEPLAIDRVTVGGIDDGCVGLQLTLVLVGDGTSVEVGSSPVGATAPDDNAVAFVLAVPVPVTAVHDAGILID